MERIALAFILVAMLTFSCDRDPYFGPVYENPNDSLQVDSTRNFLLVGCEGNFQLGNASISRVDLLDKTVSNDVFNSANGKLLGDVLQSIYRSGDSLYLILNNSGLIRIVDPISLKQIDVIKGLNSPRYMTIKNGNAYVTSLFSDKVSVINLENLQVESMIQGGDWTEHIIDLEKHFVIAEVNSNKLIVYDPNFESPTKLRLDISPRIMRKTAGGLLVAGNTQTIDGQGIIYLYDSELTLIDTVYLDPVVDVVVLDSMIYSLHSNRIEGRTMGSSRLIFSVSTPTTNNYSISASPDGSGLWLSDVKDYISKGEVLSYNLDQNSWGKRYVVGHIPQAMYFSL